MKREKKGKEMTLTGFIAPVDWDNDDEVIAIGVSTEDEDYSVEMNKLGEELFDFLDEDVEVTGIVTEDRDGSKHITVTSYEVLDSDDDEEDDEEWGLDDDEYEDKDRRSGWDD